METRLRTAFEALLYNDSILLRYDVSERTLCGRLLIYLQGVFPSHNVDIEYNRHATDPKRLPSLTDCDAEGSALVYPDLIVHRRGEDASNLLAMELKKSTNTTPRNCDRAKLEGMLEEFGYQFAVLVDLPTFQDTGGMPQFEWV